MIVQYQEKNLPVIIPFYDDMEQIAKITFQMCYNDKLGEKITYKALLRMGERGSMYALEKLEKRHDNTLLIGFEDMLSTVNLAIWNLCQRGFILPIPNREKGTMYTCFDLPYTTTYTAHSKTTNTHKDGTKKTTEHFAGEQTHDTISIPAYLSKVVIDTMGKEQYTSTKTQYISLLDSNGNEFVCGLYDVKTLGKRLDLTDSQIDSILNGKSNLVKSDRIIAVIDMLNNLPKKAQKQIKDIVSLRMSGYTVEEIANYYGTTKQSITYHLRKFSALYQNICDSIPHNSTESIKNGCTTYVGANSSSSHDFSSGENVFSFSSVCNPETLPQGRGKDSIFDLIDLPLDIIPCEPLFPQKPRRARKRYQHDMRKQAQRKA